MTFSTTEIDDFQKMIEHAVKNGLLFESYVKAGNYTIKYTGGY